MAHVYPEQSACICQRILLGDGLILAGGMVASSIKVSIIRPVGRLVIFSRKLLEIETKWTVGEVSSSPLGSAIVALISAAHAATVTKLSTSTLISTIYPPRGVNLHNPIISDNLICKHS